MKFLRPVACPRDPEISLRSEIAGSRGQATGRRVSGVYFQDIVQICNSSVGALTLQQIIHLGSADKIIMR